MEDSLGVGHRQGRAELDPKGAGGFAREATANADLALEALPLDSEHGEPGDAVLDARVHDRDQAWM